MPRLPLEIGILVLAFACNRQPTASPEPQLPRATRPVPSSVLVAAPTSPSGSDGSENPVPALVEHGPPCPPSDQATGEDMPGVVAAIEGLKSSFASCGRGAKADLVWTVPAKGAVVLLGEEPYEAGERCLRSKTYGLRFAKRGRAGKYVHARVRVEAAGDVRVDVVQAGQGKAVICEVTTRGNVPNVVTTAKQREGGMTGCFNRAFADNPAQSRRLHFELELQSDGTVSQVTAPQNNHADRMLACGISSASVTQYSPPDGGSARAGFWVVFVPD